MPRKTGRGRNDLASANGSTAEWWFEFLVDHYQHPATRPNELFSDDGRRRTGARHRNVFWMGYEGKTKLSAIGRDTMARGAFKAGQHCRKLDDEGGVRRRPIDPEARMVLVQVKVPAELKERVDRQVDEGERSAWIREAMEEKLKR